MVAHPKAEKVVYAGGGITGISYEGATNWREWLVDQLAPYGIVVLSPMRWMKHLEGTSELKSTYSPEECLELPTLTDKAIVGSDARDVARADLVFMNLLNAQEKSLGSIDEIGMAYMAKMLGQPKAILTLMEDGNVHDHPFIRAQSDYVVRTLEQGVDIVKMFFDY